MLMLTRSIPGGAHARRSARRGALAAVCLAAGLAAVGAGVSPVPALAAGTIQVTTTASSGSGSLRDAINTSNRRAGKQTITFAIPGSGPQVITPIMDLPQIVDAVKIDGYTQSGATAPTAAAPGNPLIVIDGRNVSNGLDMEGSNSEIRGLVIHSVGNDGAAVFIGNGSGNVIAGNHLGVGADGFKALPDYVGVLILSEGADNVIGGPDPADRNVISGNIYAQVQINSYPGNVVEGNRIGTNATGTAAVSSTAGSFDNFGVLLKSSGSTVKDNVIANMYDGAEVWGDDNVIQGNWFGTNADASAAIANNIGIAIEGADDNQIGGTGSGEGNVISGTVFSAVSIEPGDLEAGFDGGAAVDNVVKGNKIGTDTAGDAAIPNDSKGVDSVAAVEVTSGPTTIGGAVPGAGNVISGNAAYGIAIRGSVTAKTTVQGNLIGTDATGAPELGNGGSGVYIDAADDSAIGGSGTGEGNTIAHNGGDGVTVASGTGYTVLGNAIHDNGGLGIDLGGDGQTPNDPAPDSDTGANDLQNYPDITSTTVSGAQTDVAWSLDSTASRIFRIELFATSCDPSGYGEADTYLGASTVTTGTDGHVVGSTSVATPAAGQFVTATATLLTPRLGKFPGLFDPISTSELSACVPVP